MDHFYDGQIRRYLTQFIRAMSNFSYQDGNGVLHQIPVMYGDPSRQAASTLKKNSENTIPAAPFIACYIKGLEYEQSRLQDPTFVSKVQIRERAVDPATGEYQYVQGAGYTVERIMPSPYKLTFVADIWSTNTDQKLQILEQILVLFNPSLELQTTDNFVDWTSLTVLQLASTIWSSRQIPQGTDQNIDIASLSFTSPIWITPPAKVKKLGIITKIISNIFSNEPGTIAANYGDLDAVYANLGNAVGKTVVTPGNYELLVLNNTASLILNRAVTGEEFSSQPSNSTSWYALLDLYPGEFKAGLTQISLTTPSGIDLMATVSLNPIDDTQMQLNFDFDTLPSNTTITTALDSRGTIDAIINPDTFVPNNVPTGARYLILEDINSVSTLGPMAWLNSNGSGFTAKANDIIQWSGSAWSVIFDSTTVTNVVYITNAYTGIQYIWENNQWSKSIEGIYSPEQWSLLL
jgi:hypothetical protein